MSDRQFHFALRLALSVWSQIVVYHGHGKTLEIFQRHTLNLYGPGCLRVRLAFYMLRVNVVSAKILQSRTRACALVSFLVFISADIFLVLTPPQHLQLKFLRSTLTQT